MAFSLPYDVSDISEAATYAVRAKIEQDGKLLFSSMSRYPVLTQGASNTVDILVRKSAPHAVFFQGTGWTVIEIGDQRLTLAKPQTIAFGENGKLALFGGCNRFVGGFDKQSGKLSFSEVMAGTLMACPPAIETEERRFIDALQNVSRYEVENGELIFYDAEGAILILATSAT